MRIASFLQSLAGVVGFLTLANALPSPGTPDDRLTNAQRMARGLSPMKPARLYDGSRTNVLRPRASILPGAEPFQVAAGAAGQSNPTRKRDGGVPGYFAITGDSLRFSSAQADAATFYYPNPSTKKRLGAVVSGAFADVYAVQTGSVYLVKVGTAPSGALTEFLNPARYNGDLDPSIPVAGSSTSQSALWVTGTGGVLFLAPDYATAAAYDPQATVLVVQSFAVGSQASLSAATAAQGSSLKNPVRFYVRPIDRVFGYLWFRPQATPPQLVYTSSASSASTFYLPNFGTAAQDQRALSSYNGKTLVGTIVPSASAAYLAFADASTADSSNVVSFNIPSSGNGRVSLSSGSTAYNLFWTVQGQGPYGFQYLTCPGTDAASCGTAYTDAKPVCIEVVTGNTAPSVCDAWAAQEAAKSYTRKSAIYVYDPAGASTGYIGASSAQNSQPLVADQASAFPFYLATANANQAQQELYGIDSAGVVYRWSTDRPSGTSYELYLRNFSPSNVAMWNIPANSATTELSLGQDGATQALFYGLGLRGCASAEECPSDRGFTRTCVELVAFGAAPQLCVPGWQPPASS